MIYITQKAPDCWLICAEKHTDGPDDTILVSREVLETHDTPLEGYAALLRLNPPELANPIAALVRMFHTASTQSHSGAGVLARVLLGCYNGYRFPIDLTELRRLDNRNLEDALAVIRFDAHPAMELHNWLDLLTGRTDFGQRFEWMAKSWSIEHHDPETKQPAPLDMRPFIT